MRRRQGHFSIKTHQRVLSSCIISRARETSCVSWSPEVLFLVKDREKLFLHYPRWSFRSQIYWEEPNIHPYPGCWWGNVHFYLGIRTLWVWMEFFSFLFLKSFRLEKYKEYSKLETWKKSPSLNQAMFKGQIKSNEFMKLIWNSVQPILIARGSVLKGNCAHCYFKRVLV